jgi:hypothetical protein
MSQEIKRLLYRVATSYFFVVVKNVHPAAETKALCGTWNKSVAS